MEIKLMDIVYDSTRNLRGQVYRIRDNMVEVWFVTDEKIKIYKSKIKFIDGQWRIND